jgi:uncharacterized delta-60 repeat protein
MPRKFWTNLRHLFSIGPMACIILFAGCDDQQLKKGRAATKAQTSQTEVLEENTTNIDIAQDNILVIGQTTVEIPKNSISSSSKSEIAVRLRRVAIPADLDSDAAAIFELGKELVEVQMIEVDTQRIVQQDQVLDSLTVTQKLEADSDELSMMASFPSDQALEFTLTGSASYQNGFHFVIRKPNLSVSSAGQGIFLASAGLRASAFLITTVPANTVPESFSEYSTDVVLSSSTNSGSKPKTSSGSTNTGSTSGTSSGTGDTPGGGNGLALRYADIQGEKDDKLGSPNSSNNGTGHQAYNIFAPIHGERANSAYVTSSGRIVVVGTAVATGASMYIMGLEEYGVVDPSFGTFGITNFSIASGDNHTPVTVTDDTQGGYLVALTHQNNSNSDNQAVVVRFKADGTLDSNQFSGGRLTYNSNNGSTAVYAKDLVTNQTGNIFLSVHDQGTPLSGHVVVFSSSGSRIDNIGGTNTHYAKFPSTNTRVKGMCLAADGSVFAAGSDSSSGSHDIALMKLTPSGPIDTSFGNQGSYVATSLDINGGDNWEEGVDCAVASNGDIFVLGHTDETTHTNILVMKVLANGSGRQNSFGTNGVYVLNLPTTGNPFKIAASETGEVYYLSQEGSGHAVSALTNLGAPLNAFLSQTNPKLTLWRDTCSNEVATDMVVDAHGRLVLAGTCLDNGTSKDFSTIYRIK